MNDINNYKGLLVIISGPSGVGKTTIANKLIESGRCVRLITSTSRLPAKGEKQGIDYNFITREDFLRKLDEDYFLEYAEVFNCFYGTPINQVQRCLQEGKTVLLLIDVQGARKIRKKHLPALYLFIAPPDKETLFKRLHYRNRDSQEEIQRRLAVAEKELQAKNEYDYIIINKDIDKATGEIQDLIEKERAKILRNS